jgi:2,3-bisphosphoglycerate-independent phosphoglycerate mutase
LCENMKKTIFIICDGLGDRPVKELGNKTPLEAASKPNLDFLASKAIGGLVNVMGKGVVPHSDNAHLTIFGYDIGKEYPGRGPIEAAGIGLKLQAGDVAMRSNVATADSRMVVTDRRAGRVEDTSPFVKELDGLKIDGIKFIVKPGTGYRAVVLMRGKGLSDKITENDPEEAGRKMLDVKPADNSNEAMFTASVLNKFLSAAREKLLANPLNRERAAKGMPQANCLLVRGAGIYHELESFNKRHGVKSCCIAGAGLYKGIGYILGMDVLEVKGATGLVNTDVGAKIKAAVKALEKYDFVFVHIKPTDSLGEDGNARGKKEFIEKIDRAMKPLTGLGCGLVITADHSTPCEEKAHSADPPPIMICGSGRKPDGLKTFSEKECAAKGSLGTIRGKDLMGVIKKVLA